MNEPEKSRYARVLIKQTSTYPTYEVTIDGVDMTHKILVEGFGVDFEAGAVSMVITADALEIDMPKAVVEAIRHSEAPAVDPAKDSA